MNIRSEGFHIVEHILLRPSFKSNVFGFNFKAENGQILFCHDHWLNFEEREKALEALFKIMLRNTNIYREIADALFDVCNINISKSDAYSSFVDIKVLYDIDEEHTKKLFDKIRHNLEKYKRGNNQFLPDFNMLIKRNDGSVVAEDFFNFRLTVVLPDWPARFQEKGFRRYIEKLFSESTPVHLRIHFKWLGISQMKNFEDLYFKWAQIKNENGTGNIYNDEMVSFLLEDEFIVTD